MQSASPESNEETENLSLIAVSSLLSDETAVVNHIYTGLALKPTVNLTNYSPQNIIYVHYSKFLQENLLGQKSN